MKIAVAQLNPIVGDLAGNAERIAEAGRAGLGQGATLLVTPELSICGYPPEDLLFRDDFCDACEAALVPLAQRLAGLTAIVGVPIRRGSARFNAAAVLEGGRVAHLYFKHALPNYRVFDEERYFEPGSEPLVVLHQGVKVGITICEDVWEAAPVAVARRAGAEFIVSINGSPYDMKKRHARFDVVTARVKECGLPVLFVNQVGGQDELVFDGASFAMETDGRVTYQEDEFEERVRVISFEGGRFDGPRAAAVPAEASVYAALRLAVRDYVDKNRFPGVLLGLSGGVDSALTLAIAVDALGRDRVQAVMMPSDYTASISIEDSREMAGIQGVRYSEIAIRPMFDAFNASLAETFAGREPDTTEENLQARIRGTLLMAMSNKFGSIVLTTGNKSEMAVGYSTLYGDMAGGFAVLKDIFKTLAYRLCHWRNGISRVIPERVIDRPPSAELRPDQTDQDSLPPYEVLDAIVERFMENDQSPGDIIAAGFGEADVRRVVRLVQVNEYKRRQSPVGVKVTQRGFGKDWRYPITSRYQPPFLPSAKT
jgi:NAD+ synthetase